VYGIGNGTTVRFSFSTVKYFLVSTALNDLHFNDLSLKRDALPNMFRNVLLSSFEPYLDFVELTHYNGITRSVL
jgi:hypothetical protein